LGEIVFINSKNLTPNYPYDEIYYLDTGSVAEGRLISSYKKFYLKEAPSRAKRIVNDGDIVYSLVRPIQRHYIIIKNPPDNLIVSTGFAVITADNNKADNRFIYYYLTLDEIVEYLDSIAEGSTTTYPSIVPDDLKNIIIPLPPLPEQKAIAEVLSSLDDKIELLHRQNKTLEEMAMTLFRQWFIEPAKDGLPDGWEEVEIGDILKETIGGDWGENEKFEGSISVFCLRGIDLDNIKIYGHSNSVPIRYVSKDSLEKRTLTENQILLAGSGIGPIGKTLPIHRKMINSFNLPVIYSNFCKRLEAKNKEIAYYMEFFIFYMYKKGELDQFHSGTSIPNFNMKNFLKLKIYFPPIIDIIKFSNFLDMFYSKKFSPQIQTLEKLRDTLLPKLMSGEVRVKF
jgi:type I restriction enzyme S subunit